MAGKARVLASDLLCWRGATLERRIGEEWALEGKSAAVEGVRTIARSGTNRSPRQLRRDGRLAIEHEEEIQKGYARTGPAGQPFCRTLSEEGQWLTAMAAVVSLQLREQPMSAGSSDGGLQNSRRRCPLEVGYGRRAAECGGLGTCKHRPDPFFPFCLVGCAWRVGRRPRRLKNLESARCAALSTSRETAICCSRDSVIGCSHATGSRANWKKEREKQKRRKVAPDEPLRAKCGGEARSYTVNFKSRILLHSSTKISNSASQRG